MYLFIIIICISMSFSYLHVLDLAEATFRQKNLKITQPNVIPVHYPQHTV